MCLESLRAYDLPFENFIQMFSLVNWVIGEIYFTAWSSAKITRFEGVHGMCSGVGIAHIQQTPFLQE